MSDFWLVVAKFAGVGALVGLVAGWGAGWPKTGMALGVAFAVGVFFWILSKADFG